jgi:hypothetical protein
MVGVKGNIVLLRNGDGTSAGRRVPPHRFMTLVQAPAVKTSCHSLRFRFSERNCRFAVMYMWFDLKAPLNEPASYILLGGPLTGAFLI